MQRLVIKTKSVEFMPFLLSLAVFLCGTSWFIYGLLGRDPFITVRRLLSLSDPELHTPVFEHDDDEDEDAILSTTDPIRCRPYARAARLSSDGYLETTAAVLYCTASCCH